MQPTHVNAYRAELEEAKKEEAKAHSRVETLRETVATMEQADAATPTEVAEPVPEVQPEVPVEVKEEAPSEPEAPVAEPAQVSEPVVEAPVTEPVAPEAEQA